MRRQLIKQEDFDRMTNESVTTAERELINSEPILAKALGEDYLSLTSFDEGRVLYETPCSNFVHAGYEIREGAVTFNNIHELIIDHASRQAKKHSIMAEMIDAIMTEDDAKSDSLFNDYLEMVNWNEMKFELMPHKDDNGNGKDKKNPFIKHHKGLGEKKDISDKKSKNKEKKDKKADVLAGLQKKVDASGKKGVMKEVYLTAHNVLEYVDYMRLGPALSESVSRSDNDGNVTDLRVPTSITRNKGKLLESKWRALNTEVNKYRESAVKTAGTEHFCRAMCDLKRQNAYADQQGLEEVLENVVQAWPQLLYVSQHELAQLIGESLKVAGENNFGDETCEFMAEGILRKSHDSYTEKAKQILHLASAPRIAEGIDPYGHFQATVEQFYPIIDEKFGLERRAYTDLYESIRYVYDQADRSGNSNLKREASSFLNELADTLNGQIEPDLELAEDAATWLTDLIETNLETGTWKVSNTPHLTVSGDHPDMAKKAQHGYVPASDFSGNWGDPAPMISQDNMSYKGNAPDQARSNSWASASTGGGDIFPKLNNPYVPKPFGDYTMKGEKGVDKDTFGQHWSTWQSADTWPKLQNPYTPREQGGPGGTGEYHMKDGSETDLVRDM